MKTSLIRDILFTDTAISSNDADFQVINTALEMHTYGKISDFVECMERAMIVVNALCYIYCCAIAEVCKMHSNYDGVCYSSYRYLICMSMLRLSSAR